jgi:hypothetical protein
MAPFGNEPDPHDWIYWGPKDVLETYFKDEQSLSVPVLRVKLSSNVSQIGPNKFSGDNDLQGMLKKDPNSKLKSLMWNQYPVQAIELNLNNKRLFTAWVGMNDPEGHWVLMFNLVYPEKSGHPDILDIELWNNFLTNSK